MDSVPVEASETLSASQIADLRLASGSLYQIRIPYPRFSKSQSVGANGIRPEVAGVSKQDLVLTGAKRRAFQTEMTVKYCEGRARLAEKVFGWGRHTVALGLAEKRSGPICAGSQAGFGRRKLWEERYLDAAKALRALAEAHCQQDSSFTSSIAYTRLTATEARRQLQAQGLADEVLPAPNTMAVVLNRLGYRPLPVNH